MRNTFLCVLLLCTACAAPQHGIRGTEPGPVSAATTEAPSDTASPDPVAPAEGYRGENRDFLARNARAPGVIQLPSGLQYKVLRAGTGRTAGADDTVLIHYRSTTLDGAEFYNTWTRNKVPQRVNVHQVIRGLAEALQHMREGAMWQLFIPADLAFRERGPLADQVVVYEVELVSVESPPR